jgi:hypothetical protein
MQAWTLIKSLDPALETQQTKIHLASTNDLGDNPLDIYRRDPEEFRDWQCWQTKKNFGKDFVIALIQMPRTHEWLFAGAYTSRGCRPDGDGFRYQLEERPGCRSIDGRLVVQFERPGRQPYLHADGYADHILVSEIRSRRLSVPEFPGFKGLRVSKAELDLVVREQDPGWKAALASVAAVYLIADADSGQLYVGSATGQAGLWQRWSQYVQTGHADNVKLKALLTRKNSTAKLYFSILEIDDMRTTPDQMLEREYRWQEILLTRGHGLN